MVAELATAAVVLVASGAEMLHARRMRRLAPLAFGPSQKPAPWARAAPVFVIAACAAICWGLVTLLLINPKIHEADILPDEEKKHVVLMLDASPSMYLQDASPTKDQSRMKRASAVMESFFKRVTIEQYRVSVVAFYTGAKPVVVDTSDMEVVRNILQELPMQYAFKSGETDLFAGLEAVEEIVRHWNLLTAPTLCFLQSLRRLLPGIPDAGTSRRRRHSAGTASPARSSTPPSSVNCSPTSATTTCRCASASSAIASTC